MRSRFFKRCGQRRLRRIMRGYRFLKDSNALSLIADVKRSFTTNTLDLDGRTFSKFVFGNAAAYGEIACRQYLLARVADLNFNRALLYAFGKPGESFSYYLPPGWRKIIRNHGIKIASFRSSLLWQAFVGMMIGHGILRIARIIFDGIYAIFSKKGQELGNYIYFDSLADGNLPQDCGEVLSHDIITWYMQYPGRVRNIDALCHGVKSASLRKVNETPVLALPSRLGIMPLTSFESLFRFVGWAIVSTCVAIWDWIWGRWWHGLLLNQAALAAQVRIQDQRLLAKEYLFHLSGWIYRPLWTYEVERKGQKITFFFYATNTEGFKRTQGYRPLPYGWQTMTWPHYLVWDEYQSDFVQRAVGESASISIVGPIWFHGSAKELPIIGKKCIAVFDITPHRSSRYRTLGPEIDYYIPDTCIRFLSGVLQAAKENGCVILWKQKRKIGSMAHPHYQRFLRQFIEDDNVRAIDPDISANRVIEASMAVIAMPLTSTALIGLELGKPSSYYDATGLVHNGDRAAHGIEIIHDADELVDWLNQYTGCPTESR